MDVFCDCFGRRGKIKKLPITRKLSYASNGADAALAGAEGIEPSSKVLETPILPLNYAPK